MQNIWIKKDLRFSIDSSNVYYCGDYCKRQTQNFIFKLHNEGKINKVTCSANTLVKASYSEMDSGSETAIKLLLLDMLYGNGKCNQMEKYAVLDGGIDIKNRLFYFKTGESVEIEVDNEYLYGVMAFKNCNDEIVAIIKCG